MLCSGMPSKHGLKSLLGYKGEGMGYFSHIGIIPLKSKEPCWVPSAWDLAMTAYGCKKQSVPQLTFSARLNCTAGFCTSCSKGTLGKSCYLGVSGFIFAVALFWFSLASLLLQFYKRWYPIPLVLPIVLPFYSKLLTFKWICNESCDSSHTGYNSLKALIWHISLKLSL